MDANILGLTIQRMNRLAERLDQAIEQLRDTLPLDPETFDPDHLAPTIGLLLDGFRARFSDLQDHIGRAVFKAVAQMDEDEMPGQELTTRERIVLMEKRRLINAETWKDIREVRNSFAHEYPEQHSEKAAHLNAAWDYSPTLLSITETISHYANRRAEDGG